MGCSVYFAVFLLPSYVISSLNVMCNSKKQREHPNNEKTQTFNIFVYMSIQHIRLNSFSISAIVQLDLLVTFIDIILIKRQSYDSMTVPIFITNIINVLVTRKIATTPRSFFISMLKTCLDIKEAKKRSEKLQQKTERASHLFLVCFVIRQWPK